MRGKSCVWSGSDTNRRVPAAIRPTRGGLIRLRRPSRGRTARRSDDGIDRRNREGTCTNERARTKRDAVRGHCVKEEETKRGEINDDDDE